MKMPEISAIRGGRSSKISMTRLATLSTMFVILAVYAAHNIIAMVNGAEYVDFPANSVMVILIILGAKVGQHVSESAFKNNTDSQVG